MASYRVLVPGYRINNRKNPVGQILDIDNENDAKRLVAAGIVRFARESEPREPKPGLEAEAQPKPGLEAEPPSMPTSRVPEPEARSELEARSEPEPAAPKRKRSRSQES